MLYDFEQDTSGWGTSEGEYKKAEVASVSNPAPSRQGLRSLQIDTIIFGNASSQFADVSDKDVYRHTEATVYFDKSRPQSFGNPPYNLQEKKVSCFVFLPNSLISKDNNLAYIRIFVKDINFFNSYGEPEYVTSSVTNKWIELSFVVGQNTPGSDPDFDPSKVNTLGVRIDTSDKSGLVFEDKIYVDNCLIE